MMGQNYCGNRIYKEEGSHAHESCHTGGHLNVSMHCVNTLKYSHARSWTFCLQVKARLIRQKISSFSQLMPEPCNILSHCRNTVKTWWCQNLSSSAGESWTWQRVWGQSRANKDSSSMHNLSSHGDRGPGTYLTNIIILLHTYCSRRLVEDGTSKNRCIQESLHLSSWDLQAKPSFATCPCCIYLFCIPLCNCVLFPLKPRVIGIEGNQSANHPQPKSSK